jgi:transcriptional regulator with XRE-family HTH domain
LEAHQRLENLRVHYGLNQRDFAQKIGVSQSLLSTYLNSDKELSLSIIRGVAKVFPEINLNWLLKGQGEMIQKTKSTWIMEEPISTYNIDRLAIIKQRLSRNRDDLTDILRELDDILDQ